jgi:hypothetical protein
MAIFLSFPSHAEPASLIRHNRENPGSLMQVAPEPLPSHPSQDV